MLMLEAVSITLMSALTGDTMDIGDTLEIEY